MTPIWKKGMSNGLFCGLCIGAALYAVGSPGIIVAAVILAGMSGPSASFIDWAIGIGAAVFGGGVLLGLAIGLLRQERA